MGGSVNGEGRAIRPNGGDAFACLGGHHTVARARSAQERAFGLGANVERDKVAPRQSTDAPAEFAYAEGKAAYERRDFERAIRLFTVALEKSPTDPQKHVCRGAAMFYGRHDLAEAIAEFSQALRLDPRHVGALRGCAKAYLAAGELDKAIRDLGEVIRIDPTDAHDFYARAGAYFLKEDLDKAMADANRAVSLAPFSADIHYVRAMLHARRGERQEGLADLDLAEQMERSAPKADHDGTCLDPCAGKLSFGDSPLVSICQRAGLCHQFGRLREAIALCDEALRLDHNNLDAHVIRAEALLDQGHFDGGLAELAEVIRIDPRCAVRLSPARVSTSGEETGRSVPRFRQGRRTGAQRRLHTAGPRPQLRSPSRT